MLENLKNTDPELPQERYLEDFTLGKTAEEIKSLESSRDNIIKYLEAEFPRNSKTITKDDIINLHLINACLSITDEQYFDDEEELKATRSGLEMERDIIIDKVLGVVAYSALLDSLRFPCDDCINGGIEQYAGILDKVEYLLVRDEDSNDDYNDRGHVDYKQLLSNLMNRLGDSPNHNEIRVALVLAKDISRFSTWKRIAEKSLEILRSGSNVGSVEQLIQMIHQGGYGSLNNAKEASRPLLEHVSDRPWEVANALTFVFAGYPLLAEAKLKSSVNRYAQPFRTELGIKEFYQQGPIDIDKIYDAAKTKFFKASLSLTENLDINDISKMDSFIDPYTAADIIENDESY
jgi:hypothetical protein